MLLFSVLLALASIYLCDASDLIACEGNTLDLYCTDGTIIHVLSANYGRTSIFPCLLYFGADDCRAANSTQVVSHRCNNQQKCSVDVSNNLFGDPCPNVPKYLEVNYTCNAIEEDDQVLVTCQDEVMVLVCPDGLNLDIIDADYGRGCSDLCPSPDLRTDLNCSSPNSSDIVKENCDGFNTCILNVTNDVFGDPCVGVGKYLKVNFTCSAPTTTAITTTTPKPTYPTICENDELTINCDAGSLIDIIYAFYGRDSSTICQNLLSLPFQNCSSPNATQIVANECDNLQSCTVTASNSVFGDPCFPNTRKYLLVDWRCKTESATACEDSDLTINCPNGTSIDVASAVFGRIEDDICPGGIVPLPQGVNCSSPNATDIAEASCDQLQSCTINANVSVFGDPCPGTRKYIQVNYTCPFTSVTGPVKNGTACQGQTLYLSCPGQVINVLDAFFGRLTDDICPPLIPLGAICRSNATNEVRQLCEDEESCNVTASIFVFGDPCILTSKYLQVNYTCVDAPPPPPPPNNVTIACEGDLAEITCPGEDVINIVSANYGRTSLLTCPSILGLTTTCITPNATEVVRRRCENLNSCAIAANNSVFGDPCFGIKKYLEIVYTCQPLNANTVRACQNSTLIIACPTDTTIDVVSARYGRSGNTYCSTPDTPSVNCSTPDATSIVQEICDDKQFCAVQANNSLFGNACGTVPSYLEVSYACLKGTPAPSTSTEYSSTDINILVCDNLTHSIYCPRGEINIVYANYGRTSPTACTNTTKTVTNCRSSNTTEILRNSCENLKICTISANSSIYGDPCIGVSKYLEVIYRCEESPTLQSSVCENQTLNLSCPRGRAIDIVSVEYGRTTNNICPIANYSSGEYCVSNNASDIVKDLCDDRQSCSVIASNEELGNVCPTIPKYLQVTYKCLHSDIGTTTTSTTTSTTTPTTTTTITTTTEVTTKPPPNIIHSTVCNNLNIQLFCANDVINIVYANWGRTSATVCPSGNDQTNCTQSNTTEIVRRRCENRPSCTLTASSSEFGDPCPDVSKYLEIYYFCTSLEQNSSSACENNTLTLSCPHDTAIDIIDVVYGRLNNDICPISNYTGPTNCSSENATAIIDDRCDDKQECSVVASSALFGDPCSQVAKYLQVNYTCLYSDISTTTTETPTPTPTPAPGPNITTSSCENDSVQLSCPIGKTIDIVDVVYGRLNNQTCPTSSPVTNCSASDALQKVENLCNDQQQCTVGANNNVFGDPCPGVDKYLQITYSCSETTTTTTSTTTSTSTEPPTPTTSVVNNVYLCENLNINLNCFNGEVIDIVYANWGRTSSQICTGTNSQITNCTQPNTTEIVRRSCENRESCILSASNDEYGDPCVGVSKYLEVEYFCTELTTSTSTACENETLHLSCPRDTSLDIVSVVYGRLNNDVCPVVGGTNVTNCTSESATSIIDDRCDNKRECTVVASSALFGDPCSQVAKYLQVSYSCLYSGHSTTTTETPTPTPAPGPNITTSSCENDSVQLSCPIGKTIDIVDVVYGRLNNQTCPTSSPVTNCSASDALQKVENLCSDQQQCTVGANNNVFGDPCPGVEKYLQITYSCSETTTTTSTTTSTSTEPPTPTTPVINYVYLCEGLNINLNCFNGDVIDIVYANWGRTSSNVCNGTNSQITNCTQPNTTEIVRRSCENRESCFLSASNDEFGDPCVGVSKYLEVEYFCTELQTSTSTACENETLHLSCPRDTSLDIVSVVYGRLSDDVCPVVGGTNVTNCTSENATSIIDDRCDNKRECTVVASSALFGDPCSQVAKYLQVSYSCLYSGPTTTTTETPTPTPAPGPNITTSACENGSVQLSCPIGKTIDIVDVVYGRLSNQTCPTSSPVTNCSASDATDIVENLCNDQQQCTVGANNNVFGDPCPGVDKYLQITYSCSETTTTTTSTTTSTSTEPPTPTTPVVNNVNLCENLFINLNCFNGQVIDIVYANWGRTSSDVCNGTNSQITNCTQPNTTEIVRRSCENRESCFLSASSDEFGDPCVGVSKYLEVKYFCTELQTSTSTACENETLHLSCPRDTSLDIVSVVYGRLSDDVCPVVGGTNVTNCTSANATSIIDDRCDNKRECTVVASSALFGDPCSQVAKYLQVSYSCLYSGPTTTTTETPTPTPAPGPNITTSACENGSVQLSCPIGKTIDIVDVVYGRLSNQTCPTSSPVTNCSASDALQIVENICDDQQQCTVAANNNVFGDPCPGVEKYLQITYSCSEITTTTTTSTTTSTSTEPPTPTTSVVNNVYLCENLFINLNCLNGQVIDIMYANWGRTSSDVCNGTNSQITNCTQPNTTEIVRRSCENRESCLLSASNDEFGDPCVGVSKYLEVEYFCTELQTSTSTACENETLHLSCPRDTSLDIVSVVYGRLSDDVCPVVGGTNVTNCTSANATSIIDDRCDNKRECTVVASSALFGDPCSQVAKYLQVSYSCLYSGHSTTTTETPTPTPTPAPGPNITTSACENGSVQLSCPIGKTIDIVDVVYGRLSNETCPTSSPVTNCSASDAIQIAENLCNDQQQCTVGANNNVFGDPCPGVEKYLQITYSCSETITTTTSTTTSTSTEPPTPTTPVINYVYLCEGLNINLNCFNGDVIDIVYANWGRTSSNVCNGTNSQITNCTQPNTTEIVRRSCENRESCLLSASNDEYGDPCVGVSKYLDVEYFCTELQTSTSTACENETLHLSCPRDTSLDIVSVVYGRLSDDVCPVVGGTNVTNCTSENATSIIDDRCDNKRECTVVASSALFGDPCSQVSKYLQVSYSCLYSGPTTTTTETPTPTPAPGPNITTSACENGSVQLSCPIGKTIDIIDVVYGRLSNQTCPTSSPVTNCSASDATDIVENLCNDQQQCTVGANNNVFGDPCPGVEKYLQITYSCSEMITTTTSPTTSTSTKLPPNGTEPEIVNVTSCQGDVLLISCPDNDFILIYEAIYGSTDIDSCPPVNNNTNSNCTSNATATDILSDDCDGLSSCVVYLSTDLFENPCIGTYKSLEVLYICAKRVTNESIAVLNDTACENTELNLSCTNGDDLNIISANYGRSSSLVCPRVGQDQNTHCTLPNATLIVSESCDGHPSCSINATNSVFTDPCPGTYKYLEVEYSCPERIINVPSKKTVCQQGSSLTLTCPVGQHLQILLAIYGRLSNAICPPSGVNASTNCASPNATSVITNRCNNAETCSINATTSEFGDPCPGTNKYLEVYYRCSRTFQCGFNEKIGCANSCSNRMCGTSSNATQCLTLICIQGCVCQKDYLRDPNTGLCVEEKYCPLPGRECQTHEVFSQCGAGCQVSCLEPHPICTKQCISGYVCKNGFVRDTSTGRCVRSEDCPCT